jgi:RNA polymerase sigma-70 factor (ECF subfamily)
MDKQDQELLFQSILEHHKGILFKVARAYCPDEEDRQDLIQEMMIQIWQSVHKYDDRYKLSTWLYRISLNVAISFYRKSSARARNVSNLDVQDDETDIEPQLKLLETFISELKDIDKALMILYLEDKSHAEMADIMGMSTSNVGTKIGRIKASLKDRFSQISNESYE